MLIPIYLYCLLTTVSIQILWIAWNLVELCSPLCVQNGWKAKIKWNKTRFNLLVKSQLYGVHHRWKATTFVELKNDFDELHPLIVQISRTGSGHYWILSKPSRLFSSQNRSMFKVETICGLFISPSPSPAFKWQTKYKIVIIKQTLSTLNSLSFNTTVDI